MEVKHEAIGYIEDALSLLEKAKKSLYRPDEKSSCDQVSKAMKSAELAILKIKKNEQEKNIEGQMSIEDILER